MPGVGRELTRGRAEFGADTGPRRRGFLPAGGRKPARAAAALVARRQPPDAGAASCGRTRAWRGAQRPPGAALLAPESAQRQPVHALTRPGPQSAKRARQRRPGAQANAAHPHSPWSGRWAPQAPQPQAMPPQICRCDQTPPWAANAQLPARLRGDPSTRTKTHRARLPPRVGAPCGASERPQPGPGSDLSPPARGRSHGSRRWWLPHRCAGCARAGQRSPRRAR